MTPASDGPALSRRSFLAAAAVAGAAATPLTAAADARPAPPKELYCQSATRLLEMIRRKEVPSEQVVKAHLDRIEEVNPKINAEIPRADKQAQEQARRADLVPGADKQAQEQARRADLVPVPGSRGPSAAAKGAEGLGRRQEATGHPGVRHQRPLRALAAVPGTSGGRSCTRWLTSSAGSMNCCRGRPAGGS